MNQRPMENKPLSSSKPPAYIPPVKRPGQIPPLQQPPVQPLQKQILAENESPLQKSGPQNMSDPRIGSNVSTPQTDPPVSQPASVSDPGTVPAAKQTVPAAAGVVPKLLPRQRIHRRFRLDITGQFPASKGRTINISPNAASLPRAQPLFCSPFCSARFSVN